MKIYIIGDSISIQYGPYLKTYLQGIIHYSRKEGEEEALLNLDEPQGANGGNSERVLDFLKSKAQSDPIDADLLLINCGLHDIRTNPQTGEKMVSIENYEKNLKEMIQLAKEMKTTLVWINTTPCDEKIHNVNMGVHRFIADCEAYNQVATRLMKEAGIPIIDLFGFTQNLGDDLYCDHVHFNDHIREKQASFIAGWLNAYQALK
ncbi:SGNH/GDSL hydrolase family protein [Kiritimatiellota bacterium B12222]|nr:SGNH/GDSL hydrolase family protein [Kiritimatiellota bacterium B12222]